NTTTGISITGGGGNITASTHGSVSGDWAVIMPNVGNGSVAYDAFANITGTDGAVRLSTVNGGTALGIHGNGTVIRGGSVGNASIVAVATGAGNVTITTDAGTSVTSGDPGGAAIVGNASGGLLTITTNGNVTSGNVSGLGNAIVGLNTTGGVIIHANG